MADRIATRLAKLESSSGSGQLSDDGRRLLVQLLARLDAIFWPFRTHEGSYRAECRRLQREYLAGSGGLKASAQGESSWKSAHFARNEIIAAGLVSPHISGGQVTGLRLTPQGTADARAMIGCRLRSVGDPLACYVLDTIRSSDGWLAEFELFTTKIVDGDNPTRWDHATESVLPLLRAGLVESNSDLWNRVYYKAVDGAEIPSEPASSLTEQPWSDGLYVSTFDSERASLKRLECVDGGIVIPMRCT